MNRRFTAVLAAVTILMAAFVAAPMMMGKPFLAGKEQGKSPLSDATVFAQQPQLRDEVVLNGTWSFTPEGQSKTTIPVPEYWDAKPGFTNLKHAVYERTVSVPSSWSGNRVYVEFMGVNMICEVFVNNTSVGTHIGGFQPFSFHITSLVAAGQNVQLKVDVKSSANYPYSDTKGFMLWPVGPRVTNKCSGIGFDVYLRSYGQVRVLDAYIQTSCRNMKIDVQYEVCNSTDRPATFILKGEITPWKQTEVEKSFESAPVTLASGETKTIEVSSSWPAPRLWSPADPFLYVLHTSIMSAGVALDKEHRRFGFREVRIEGRNLLLNGKQVQLCGESIVLQTQYNRKEERYTYMTPGTWGSTLDRLFALNVNVIRFHQGPAFPFVYDLTDERGMLVISESAIYARGTELMTKANKPVYFQNAKLWTPSWVKGHRNHPSIIVWSSENEMSQTWVKGSFTKAECLELNSVIRSLDNTRPVINAVGDAAVAEEIQDNHYPARGKEDLYGTYSGGLYDILANKTKPTFATEFMGFWEPYDETLVKGWWQGTLSRGLRYNGYSVVMPYRLEWAWDNTTTRPVRTNLINSLAPVALFDYDYDKLGVRPVRENVYPSVIEGNNITRRLVLYNGEFANESITVEVEVRVRSVIYASGSKLYTVPLGEKRELEARFQVPNKGGLLMDMVLRTKKNGVTKFQEDRWFNISDAGRNGATSNTVQIADSIISAVETVPVK